LLDAIIYLQFAFHPILMCTCTILGANISFDGTRHAWRLTERLPCSETSGVNVITTAEV
jgi:hypothetical protein